ncbi:MAG: biotin--[acetyl-CoA-carboxylase] ligase [Clostridiales Family XIII bacterium]|nr:biotin--[acetyl-CoA-carboxylase] ligase [Clostridiales Family XIII bacterium]
MILKISTKNKVLEILESNLRQPVSGEQIAGQLGISRAAVNKAIAELRKDGIEITAKTRSGYVLEQSPDNIYAQDIAAALGLPACNVIVLNTIDSTNNEAKRMLNQSTAMNFPAIIIANEQTAGRGRHNRTFVSPKASSVYLSTIIKPDLPMDKMLLVTIAAAVAIVNAIEEQMSSDPDFYAEMVHPKIKWVNDIYVGSRKVCGILTEAITDVETMSIDKVVVGIGINIGIDIASWPEELRDIVGSIDLPQGERSVFVGRVLRHLLACIDMIAQDEKKLMDAYRAYSCVIGEPVRFVKQGMNYEGLAETIEYDGSLRVRIMSIDGVQHDDYLVEHLSYGEISIQI